MRQDARVRTSVATPARAGFVSLAVLLGCGCAREVEPRSPTRVEPLGVGGGWVHEPDPEVALYRAPTRPKLSHTVVIRDAYAWEAPAQGPATPVVAMGQSGSRGVPAPRFNGVRAPAAYGWTDGLAPPRGGVVILPPRSATGPTPVATPPRGSGGGSGGTYAPPASSPSRVPGLR